MATMAIWLYGYGMVRLSLAKWLQAYISTWLNGVGLWHVMAVCGYMVVWLYSYPAIWLYGYMG